MLLLYQTKSKEKIYRHNRTIIVDFPGPRRVLSTSIINGGCREDMKVVFNHSLTAEECDVKNLPDGSVEKYLILLTKKLGLPSEQTAGMLTSAKMENVSIKTMAYKDLAITAVVTGGIAGNGGRVCDPAAYYEEEGIFTTLGGTINIILIIAGNLPPSTMARTIVTATEAKSAALQELMAPSLYSSGIATGTGTDQISVVADPSSPFKFTDAGKHSKLGELIGLTVKESVKEALFKSNALGPEQQRNFLMRWKRYGVGIEDFWHEAQCMGINISQAVFLEKINRFSGDEGAVALAATLVHLLDEYTWGLLSAEAVREAGQQLVYAFSGRSVICEITSDPVSYLRRLFIKTILKRIFLPLSLRSQNNVKKASS